MSFDRQCLDVAAWEIRSCRSVRKERRYSHAHLRQLFDFMKEVERAVVNQGWDGVFVELVRDHVLQKHLRDYGYVKHMLGDDPRPCFFKSRASIVATSPWVSDLCMGVRTLSKPSLSAFAADPSLSAFWIRDQASGYQILLKREVMDVHSLAPKLRVTIAEFNRGFAKKRDLDSDDPFASSHDPLVGRQVLSRVLARLQRSVHGVSQIAIRLEALQEGRGASGNCQWLLDQGYEIERHSRMRETITDRLVKHLR